VIYRCHSFAFAVVYCIKYQVLTAVNIEITCVWDLMSFIVVRIKEPAISLPLQVRRVTRSGKNRDTRYRGGRNELFWGYNVM
jgi:hypothetical protein